MGCVSKLVFLRILSYTILEVIQLLVVVPLSIDAEHGRIYTEIREKKSGYRQRIGKEFFEEFYVTGVGNIDAATLKKHFPLLDTEFYLKFIARFEVLIQPLHEHIKQDLAKNPGYCYPPERALVAFQGKTIVALGMQFNDNGFRRYIWTYPPNFGGSFWWRELLQELKEGH